MNVERKKFNERDYTQATLKDWQLEFAEIYDNQNRTRTPENIWLNAIQDMSNVAEALRLKQYNRALRCLTYVFCWSATFAIDMVGYLDDIVWNKYPAVCLYCATVDTKSFSPCGCGIRVEERPGKKPNKKLREHFTSQVKFKPKNLDEWVGMFKTIFGQKPISTTDITYHLMEEIGEVPRALQDLDNYKKIRYRIEKDQEEQIRLLEHFESALRDEVADVFSWICSLANDLMKILQEARAVSTAMRFSDKLYGEFSNACFKCGDKPCTCELASKIDVILREGRKPLDN